MPPACWWSRGASLEDRCVRDLPALLRPGDLLVFNDTRVIPARLLGRRGAAKIEVTLHQPVDGAAARAEQGGRRLPAQLGGRVPGGARSRGRRADAASATACASARTSRPRCWRKARGVRSRLASAAPRKLCSSGSSAAATCRCRPTSGVRPGAMRRTAPTIRPCSPRAPAPSRRLPQRSTSRRA